MTRIATTLICLSAPTFFAGPLLATDAAIEGLRARIVSLESRLSALEKMVDAEPGSSTYQTQAVLEATQGGSAAAASGESFTYVIKEGDTLGSIAGKHGVERASLLELNRLSEGQPIYIGETLLVPGTRPGTSLAGGGSQVKPESATETTVVVGDTKPSEASGGTAQTHTVVKGDTLTSIAARYKTSVASLKSTNGLKSDVISLGQKLALPSSVTTVASSGGGQSAQTTAYEYDNPLLRTNETYGYYTVQKGDNLYALARDFFTSMAELQRLNELGDSTVIHPGDDLIVPTTKYNAHHNERMAQR